MYSEMSFSGSALSRCKSCATTRFATWSSIGVPRKMIRSLSSLEYMSNSRSPRAVCSITIGISGISPNPTGRGPWVLALFAALVLAAPAGAMTSHAGLPADQHLVMDKGPSGLEHVLTGVAGKHNYLLGGYGDDTIYGGNSGDV